MGSVSAVSCQEGEEFYEFVALKTIEVGFSYSDFSQPTH